MALDLPKLAVVSTTPVMVEKPTVKPNIAAAIAKLTCLRRLAANSCDGRHIFGLSDIIILYRARGWDGSYD